jgi:archaemetzincin
MMVADEQRYRLGRRESTEARLTLLPVACSAEEELKALAEDLAPAGIDTALAQCHDIDPAAYTKSRLQYRAEALLEQACQAVAGRVLVITDADLYAPGLNFVFGMADRPGRAAVVSLHRLRLEADAALLRERLLKEALHEIGHMFGLAHCFDPHCVMSFSDSLSDADHKSHRFCRACQAKFTTRLRERP